MSGAPESKTDDITKSNNISTESGAVDDLARHLHWTMLRIDLLEDDDWNDLTEASKEFYRACIRELLVRRELLLSALGLSPRLPSP
jgi:hypothetical protein